MRATVWIHAAAGYNLALAVLHLGFWRLFKWREELAKVHPANRGVMQALNVMLTFVFVAVAALQICLTDDVAGSPVGRAVLGGMAAFWLLRAILQPAFWPEVPRRVNYGIATLFLAGAVLHALALRG